MRKLCSGLAALLVPVVAAQFFLAATGAFGGGSFGPHRALGWVAFFLPVVLAVVAALGRRGRLAGMAGLVAGLVAVQVGVAKLAEALGHGTAAGQLVFGLHAVAGLAVLAVTGLIARCLLAGRSAVRNTRAGAAAARVAGRSPGLRDPGA